MKAKLILSNGAVFEGVSMGSARDRVCEIVFNTSMAGYQEILTDPACAGQGIVMSYPLIGNYGVNHEDVESDRCWADALIVRRLSPRGSNFRCEGTLDDYLRQQDVTGICGVDTRAIIRMLRDQGCMNGLITTREEVDMEQVLSQLAAYQVGDAALRVSQQAVRTFDATNAIARVALYDFGTEQNVIRSLTERGCQVTVLPASTPAEEVIGKYDGVVLSNGPGDPKDYPALAEQVKKLYSAGIPMFGIGLGHQLMALAIGAQTEKMPYGHRGCNHPVRELATGRVYITTQNHGYAVKASSVDPAAATVSYSNANDNTVEGLNYANGQAFSVQFQPAISPRPSGDADFYGRFIRLMGGKHHA